MRLARASVRGRLEYLAFIGDEWRPLSAFGIEARDTPELMMALPKLVDRIGDPGSAFPRPCEDFVAPIVRPSKIVALAFNYPGHAGDLAEHSRPSPVLFEKFPNALTGPFDPIRLDPSISTSVDYEAELALVIGRQVRKIRASDGWNVVGGLLVANDVTARDLQKADGQVARSKGIDTFCPVGPFITTPEGLTDRDNLMLTCHVNGHLRQSTSTSEMILSVPEIIEFVSRSMTLEGGDMILTGTPGGIGAASIPPRFLQTGDVVRCAVDGLGYIANNVVVEKVYGPR